MANITGRPALHLPSPHVRWHADLAIPPLAGTTFRLRGYDLIQHSRGTSPVARFAR
jgi:hypothetical protein